MGMLLTKAQCYEQLPVIESSATGRLESILMNWLLSKSSLHYSWEKFRAKPAGRNVSYRAWSRHGAYLELSLETHQSGNVD